LTGREEKEKGGEFRWANGIPFTDGHLGSAVSMDE
jgi:hypothetical protein